MTMAREARGFSREQAASASNIPGYYLTMIETDDYSAIADQLYLLPFLRRYATFVGLEPEEVASRFIREVQRADMNPGRPAESIPMLAERKTFSWRIVAMTAGAIVIIAAVWFGYRQLAARRSAMANSKAPMAEEQVVVPNADEVAPKAADIAPAKVEAAPMSAPSIAVVPAAAPSAAVAAPAAVASAAVPPAVASAPLGASAANSAGRPAARASSSAPSRSPAARPRVPVKPH